MKRSQNGTKLVSAASLLMLALFAMGCQPQQGPQGPQGAPGSGRLVSTMNCFGTVGGLVGPAAGLNGYDIEYQAVLTDANDVYATAAIITGEDQISGTRYYAANQAGADQAEVNITADLLGNLNGGLWKISVDRFSRITRVVYDDYDLATPVDLQFTADACEITNW